MLGTVVCREVLTVGQAIEQPEESDRQGRRQNTGMNGVKGREDNVRNKKKEAQWNKEYHRLSNVQGNSSNLRHSGTARQ